jgi:hypothetical protein
MFVIVQMEDVELTGVELFGERDTANERFDEIAYAGSLMEWDDDDLKHECVGTIRGAGDDVESVQLLEIH